MFGESAKAAPAQVNAMREAAETMRKSKVMVPSKKIGNPTPQSHHTLGTIVKSNFDNIQKHREIFTTDD
jgi:hypothetical protein